MNPQKDSFGLTRNGSREDRIKEEYMKLFEKVGSDIQVKKEEEISEYVDQFITDVFEDVLYNKTKITDYFTEDRLSNISATEFVYPYTYAMFKLFTYYFPARIIYGSNRRVEMLAYKHYKAKLIDDIPLEYLETIAQSSVCMWYVIHSTPLMMKVFNTCKINYAKLMQMLIDVDYIKNNDSDTDVGHFHTFDIIICYAVYEGVIKETLEEYTGMPVKFKETVSGYNYSIRFTPNICIKEKQ